MSQRSRQINLLDVEAREWSASPPPTVIDGVSARTGTHRSPRISKTAITHAQQLARDKTRTQNHHTVVLRNDHKRLQSSRDKLCTRRTDVSLNRSRNYIINTPSAERLTPNARIGAISKVSGNRDRIHCITDVIVVFVHLFSELLSSSHFAHNGRGPIDIGASVWTRSFRFIRRRSIFRISRVGPIRVLDFTLEFRGPAGESRQTLGAGIVIAANQ